MEERISELEGRNLEMIQVEEERTKIFFLNEEILWELYDTNRREKIRIMGLLEGEERENGPESLFKEVITALYIYMVYVVWL